jgi:hypothetical protein
MTPAEAIAAMQRRSDVLAIETARIEGSLRTINDMGGYAAAEAAAKAALRRVCLNSTDKDGWIA